MIDKKAPTRKVRDKRRRVLFPHTSGYEGSYTLLSECGWYSNDANGAVVPVEAVYFAQWCQACSVRVTPFEIRLAAQASKAYVEEHDRSFHKTTDAPFSWPMTDDQREMIYGEAEKELERALSLSSE